MGTAALITGGALGVLGLGTTLLGQSQARKMDKKQRLAQEEMAKKLKNETKDNASKRKALFETEGGVLGEEVQGVGNINRGTLFGN